MLIFYKFIVAKKMWKRVTVQVRGFFFGGGGYSCKNRRVRGFVLHKTPF